ncbi:hypothetical protein CWI37_1147p0010 [Hamiltosporidium tvaerminnensis]|uniref:Uncharacterized protein n=1 Tax=Hamiltosporidium tvaerminnensis TaxID=1176355 RepID=A0A4Q9KZA5_9MICR|nr:hypothetical protein CWI37_1147p0010 [Hamiltosporidium tvaerminnensis]
MFSFQFLINHLYCICSPTISFFIANDGNEVREFVGSHEKEENSVKFHNTICSSNDYKVYVLRNEILCFESPQKPIKYFKPEIITVPCAKMLQSSNLIQKSLNYTQNNINIFVKNVSYTAFLLFLKAIENPDGLISQMKLVDLLDILKIITTLDIAKSFKRDFFLKNIIKNILFGLERHSNIFDFLNKFNEFSLNEIDRFLIKDLLIFFINIICFNNKAAERFMILSTNKCLNLKNQDHFSPYNWMKKVTQTKFYIKFIDRDIYNLYKMSHLPFFLGTWKFLLNIATFEYFYILFQNKRSIEQAIVLFQNTKLNCIRIYIIMKVNYVLIADFFTTIFSNSIQILKISANISAGNVKDIFEVCSNVQKLTIKCTIVTFEFLSLIIKVARINSTKAYKIRCIYYEFENTDLNSLLNMPINLLFYVDLLRIDTKEVFIVKNLIPFMSQYNLSLTETDIMISYNIFLFDCFKFKELTIVITDSISFVDLDKFTISSLMNFKTLKYLTIKNIKVTTELLMYILESNILVYLNISNFITQIDFKKILEMNTQNFKLRYMLLRNSISCFKKEILWYLSRFVHLVGLSLEDIEFRVTKSIMEYFFAYLHSLFKKTPKKISLKRLEIILQSNTEKEADILASLSHIYELSKLNELIYKVYRISNADFKIFSQMNALEAIIIQIYDSDGFCLRNTLSNCQLYASIYYIDLALKKIREDDIIMIKKFYKLTVLFISCEQIDYETIIKFKKNDFKSTKFVLKQPSREKRSKNINDYLDSEFIENFL